MKRITTFQTFQQPTLYQLGHTTTAVKVKSPGFAIATGTVTAGPATPSPALFFRHNRGSVTSGEVPRHAG